jgi:hypothetical protein
LAKEDEAMRNYTEYGTEIETTRGYEGEIQVFGLDFSPARMANLNNIFRPERLLILIAFLVVAYFLYQKDGDLKNYLIIAGVAGIITILLVNALDTNLPGASTSSTSQIKEDKKKSFDYI